MHTFNIFTGKSFKAQTALAFILGCMAFSVSPAFAETTGVEQPLKTQTLSETQDGSLLFKTDVIGEYIKAPMVATDVNIDVAGPIIRTTLSQTFKNTTSEWVEGVYVFPLPENAAVDRLKMVVGGRLIEGQIKEKQEAKKIYETAKAEGKKASLVTQERPNVFTSAVANIGPGESVSIQIEYQDKARIQDGVFSLRFPMTVAPRYSPPRETVKVASAEGQTTLAILDPVLDRDRISPPLMPPMLEPDRMDSESYLRLPVTLNINLQAGFPLQDIDSPYHQVTIDKAKETGIHIALKDGPVPANRDFKLEWQAQPSGRPYVEIFREDRGDDSFLLAMLTPTNPVIEMPEKSYPRESIFVIDTSGSMGGTSIEQARASLLMAIDRLGPEDSFNIIQFASSHSSLFGLPVRATAQNVNRARRFVNGLDADGGTKMVPALKAALEMTSSLNGIEDGEALAQIIFITDGAIGNEKEMFALLKRDLGKARFFPVGIGSAPNSHFMSRSAKFGRGMYVQIGKTEEVQKRMSTLFKAIDNPVLTHVSTNLKSGFEAYPSYMPDLYDGEPVVFAAKLPKGKMPETLKLMGRLAQSPWSMSLDMTAAKQANGISTLWARQKIADLEDQRFDRSQAASLDEAILETALNYHLVSRLTSLVAVDVTPSRPMGEGLTQRAVPTQLPEGWDFAALTGNERSIRPPSSAPASSPAPVPSANKPVAMPGTASPHMFLLFLGGLLMALSGIVSRRFRRA
ncbi:MAG: marine proteobacterial sortase target protein [Alphaproteobacteria bacterium]